MEPSHKTTVKKISVLRSTPQDRLRAKAQEGFVETSDHQALHYQIFGQKGPLLVLCDGVGCDGYIWKYLIPDFARTYQVLHWQYRGHGQSSTPQNYATLTIVQMAKDLHQLLGELTGQGQIADAEKAVLLGHSMGAQVILEYHRLFGSKKIAALIPICGAAGHTLDDFMNSKILKKIFPFLLDFFRTLPEIAGFIWNRVIANPNGYYPALLFQLTSTLCAKEDLQPYLDHLARIDSRVFIELAGDMGKHTASDHLTHVNVPTLVFAGSRDRFTPVARTREIAEQVPGAEFCLLRAGTHTAPLELPELIILRIRKFLEENQFV